MKKRNKTLIILAAVAFIIFLSVVFPDVKNKSLAYLNANEIAYIIVDIQIDNITAVRVEDPQQIQEIINELKAISLKGRASRDSVSREAIAFFIHSENGDFISRVVIDMEYWIVKINDNYYSPKNDQAENLSNLVDMGWKIIGKQLT